MIRAGCARCARVWARRGASRSVHRGRLTYGQISLTSSDFSAGDPVLPLQGIVRGFCARDDRGLSEVREAAAR